MPRECALTGRKTSTGRTLRHRGKAKYLGGVGTKITGKNKRRFRPNLHKMNVMIDGKPQRALVSSKALRKGLVVKPPKRKHIYKHELQEE